MTHPQNSDRPRQDRPEIPSFTGEIKQGLAGEARSLLKWIAWGAGLGAILLGGAGFWLLDLTGLAYGAGAGALAGGLGALWFYSEI